MYAVRIKSVICTEIKLTHQGNFSSAQLSTAHDRPPAIVNLIGLSVCCSFCLGGFVLTGSHRDDSGEGKE